MQQGDGDAAQELWGTALVFIKHSDVHNIVNIGNIAGK